MRKPLSDLSGQVPKPVWTFDGDFVEVTMLTFVGLGHELERPRSPRLSVPTAPGTGHPCPRCSAQPLGIEIFTLP